MSLPRAMTFLYPRMFAIHDLPQHVGFVNEKNGRLELPAFLRASYSYMVADGGYVLCESIDVERIEGLRGAPCRIDTDSHCSTGNGEIVILWLGSAVSPQILNDLYGVDDLDQIDTRIVSLSRTSLIQDSS